MKRPSLAILYARAHIPRIFILTPAPPEAVDFLGRELNTLDGLDKEEQRAVTNLCWVVFEQVQFAKMLGSKSPGSKPLWIPPEWRSPSPAVRQQLKWLSKRFATVAEKARREELPHLNLLLRAQTDLENFQRKQRRKQVRQIGGDAFLRKTMWFALPLPFTYGLYSLFTKYAAARLKRAEILRRISILQSRILRLNVERTTIEKQIQRFAESNRVGWMNPFLSIIENLPPWQPRTKS